MEKATKRSTGFIDSDWNVDMRDLLKLLKSAFELIENIVTKHPTGEEYQDVLPQVLSAGFAGIDDGVERKLSLRKHIPNASWKLPVRRLHRRHRRQCVLQQVSIEHADADMYLWSR